jgi:hypothetical protein
MGRQRRSRGPRLSQNVESNGDAAAEGLRAKLTLQSPKWVALPAAGAAALAMDGASVAVTPAVFNI